MPLSCLTSDEPEPDRVRRCLAPCKGPQSPAAPGPWRAEWRVLGSGGGHQVCGARFAARGGGRGRSPVARAAPRGLLAGAAEREVTELVSADFDPVIGAAQFRPPAGSLIAEGFGDALGAGGPVWWAAKNAAGLAAGGLGAWIRYGPPRNRQPATDAMDFEAAIPAEDPAPDLTPEGRPARPPVSDHVLALLHQGGPAAFTATLHEWMDLGAMASQVPAAARRVGFGGLGLLLDAVSDQ